MPSSPLYIGSTPVQAADRAVRGEFVTLGGERFYRIADYDAMDPFFMSLVSGADHWLFISSLGGLTAGRRNADGALFPYYTSDRIHDGSDHTGSRTILRVRDEGRRYLWEPFARHDPGLYRRSRNLYKNVYGNVLVFEEVNHDLGLTFRYSWTPSDRFGFVKRSELGNTRESAVTVEFLDGVENLLPWGLSEAFQSRFSVLGDAYKQNELEAETGLGIFALSSLPGDSAEPAEALRATVCWSTCPPGATRLLSSLQLDAFRRGEPLRGETRLCGRRGAYFVSDTLELAAGERRDWLVVADVDYGHPEIARLRSTLQAGHPGALVAEDVARSTHRLVGMVARADGLQTTGDRLASAHHFANVLFNVMRGGVFESGYRIPSEDLGDFVRAFNGSVWERHRAVLEGLGEEVELGTLLERVEALGDPTLLRLVSEYLPLSFSRRHGDPSRPWNRFSIEVQDRDGSRVLAYEGNWRDIFQNWEALCLSFPEYLEGVIGKFVNTSTADGHNPYRVTHRGFDWERPAPDEPWANLGYWGDHQLIYLLKLLEWSRAHHPARLEGLLREPRFVYADVPYDIEPYEELLADPKHGIAYDADREARIEARVEALGLDGQYVTNPEGEICRANLTEKLLVPLLAKLGSFVPEGGFWMNTQRPEWNDANNALAGFGASMVTLYYARRYATFCLELLGTLGEDAVDMNREVARWLDSTHAVLRDHRDLLDGGAIDDVRRKTVLDGLAGAAGDYRAGVYESGLGGETRRMGAARLRDFLELARAYLDHSIARNRRPDGLYHAYNILDFSDDAIGVERLYPMLEGQVAVLSSGALGPAEAVGVLEALRASDMYRSDQHSYMLYPARRLPGFLEKNTIPAARADGIELLSRLVADGNTELVEQGPDGDLHFHGTFRNARDVVGALEVLRDGGYGPLVDRDGPHVVDLFEELFDHQRFTGRSGTFYGYEGLGCIYWHQVGKLLLAVQEVALAATDDEESGGRLADWYHDVRAGLGFNHPPDVFGAFPTDPYSHTPGHAGAKQPGMTGQVKEEILTRWGELGVRVEAGSLHFRPRLLRSEELLQAAEAFAYRDVRGEERAIPLEPGSLGFTYCQVPVVYRRTGVPGIVLHLSGGEVLPVEGVRLDPAHSAEIFRRSGAITRIEVTLAPGWEA